jgi:putative hydrolase
VFALESDAHAGAELAYADLAIAHARLARIPTDRVINTWPAERLAEWARRKTAHHATARAARFRP